MSSEKALALVLKTVDFSETSSVVTLFTREAGKVRALAKGARRLKGPFEAALDLLALCRIVFLRKSSDALDLLTEAKLERRFRPASGDLSSLYAAYYIAELLDELTDDYDPHPDLFDLADRTLVALSQSGDVAAVVLRFELGALREVGQLPSLDACVECGNAVEMNGRVAFGQLAGGVLCPACRQGKKQVISISQGVLTAMRHFATSHTGSEATFEMESLTQGELRAVMNRYLANLLGREPRMHRYLATLAT